MIRIALIAAFLILSTAFGRSAEAQDSRVWIEGTTSVNSFTCESDSVEGSGLLSALRTTAVKVAVDTLDCGDKRMNKDLRGALKSERHPLIRFDVSRLDVEQVTSEQLRVETTGSLEIAGTERAVAISLDGRRQSNGTIRITGSTALRLTAYGIEPPTALLGLVKVHDRVVVHFDLVESAADVLAYRGTE